jgi:hypothetical protein
MILENSYKHLINKLYNNQIIYSNLITNKIVNLVKYSHSVEQFIEMYKNIWSNTFSNLDIDWIKTFCFIKEMREESELNSKLLAFAKILQNMH